MSGIEKISYAAEKANIQKKGQKFGALGGALIGAGYIGRDIYKKTRPVQVLPMLPEKELMLYIKKMKSPLTKFKHAVGLAAVASLLIVAGAKIGKAVGNVVAAKKAEKAEEAAEEAKKADDTKDAEEAAAEETEETA